MNQVRTTPTRPRADEPIPEGTDLSSASSSNPAPDPAAPYLSRRTTKVVLGLILFASFGAGAYVLYFVGDPTMRVVLGVPVLLSVMWTSSYVSIIDRAVRAIDERRRMRRYPKLRARVVQMLDEIKRMHWLVVDINRGFRDEDAGRAEMEAIQRHLIELVGGIPGVAGVEDPGK